jgi:NADH-quinone oxidoreductase subunit G
LVLSTWKQLIDDGRMLDGEEFLEATGRRPVALVSAPTLARLGVMEGDRVTLSGPHGSTDLPVLVADLPDGVVWAPASSRGVRLNRDLGVGSGSTVRLAGHTLEPRPEPAGSEGGVA